MHRIINMYDVRLTPQANFPITITFV